MSMRQNVCCLLFAVLLAAGVCGAATAGQLKIGLLYEQTGGGASMGERHLEGAKLAVKEINAAGGVAGMQIELIAEDDMTTNPGAINALEKVLDSKPHAVIAPGFSTMLQAMAPRVKQAGLPTVMGGSLVSLTGGDNPDWKRIRAADNVSAIVMVNHVLDDLGFTKIAVLHDSEAFGQGGASQVTASLAKKNLKPVYLDSYTAGSKDFTPQLLNAQKAGAQVLIVFSPNSQDAAVILRQTKELDVPYEIVGSAAYGTANTLGIAGRAAEGLRAVQEFNRNANDRTRKFAENYTAAYGKEPDHFSAWTYDAVYVLADAVKRAGSTEPAPVKDALKNTKNLEGALGTFTADEKGDMMHAVRVIHIENGKPVVLR